MNEYSCICTIFEDDKMQQKLQGLCSKHLVICKEGVLVPTMVAGQKNKTYEVSTKLADSSI